MKYKVVAISDLHCGHLAGMTPKGWQVKRNEFPKIYKLEHEMFSWYTKMTEKHGKPDLVINCGDACDGKGKRSGGSEQLTSDRLEQIEMAVRCLEMWQADKYVSVYGTPYHTGKEEDFERLLTVHLNNSTIHNHAFIDVGGVIFDVKHKVGTSSVPYSRATAVAKEKTWNLLWQERDNCPKSDIILRGHVHYHRDTGIRGIWRAMTMPCLQAPHTKFGARQCSGTIWVGLIVFTIENGSWDWVYEECPIKASKVSVEKI